MTGMSLRDVLQIRFFLLSLEEIKYREPCTILSITQGIGSHLLFLQHLVYIITINIIILLTTL